jgi:hypothetical protein
MRTLWTIATGALLLVSLARPARAADAPAATSSVHLEGPAGARLELSLDSVHPGGWDTICTAPCDAEAPSDGAYRIAGAGLRASKLFTLRARAGEHEELLVHPASKAWYALGWVAFGVSTPAIAVPLFTAVAYPLLSLSGAQPQLSGSTVAWLLVAAGAGLAVGGTGLALIFAHRSTSVAQEVRAPEPAAPTSPGTGPAAIELPLVSRSF